MISWIVATHDPTILYRNLLPSLDFRHDEIVVIPDAPSIAAAYTEGQKRAKQPVRCYVHHDVEVLDLPRLKAELVEHTTAAVGMVGLIGSRARALPWWEGQVLGSVFDQRIGVVGGKPGGECMLLDGLLLATVHEVQWDESIPGWHGYDHDACEQMLARGLPNWCLTGGAEMVRHNGHNPSNPDELPGFHDAMARIREKWGSDGTG